MRATIEKTYAVIVAGGQGTRFQKSLNNNILANINPQGLPKQFLLLKGKPILMYTLECFYNYSDSIHIILVLPQEQMAYWKSLCDKYQFTIPHQIVAGGKTRTESVANGLQQVPDDSLVAIHDGVRPLLSSELISRLYKQAAQTGCAIPTLPLTDTLRHISGHLIDRNSILRIQTPQVFDSKRIKAAYQTIGNEQFTDDASVYEHAGNQLFFVEGETNNIKITTASTSQ